MDVREPRRFAAHLGRNGREAEGHRVPHDGDVLGAPSFRDRLSYIISGTGRLRQEAAAHRVTGLAAEVAFYAVLGVFPGLLALAAALGFMETLLGGELAERAQRVVIDFLRSSFGDGTSGIVEAVRALFDEGDPALLSLAMAGAVWSMWRATRASMRALAVVYDLDEARSPVRVSALALALALGTLIVAALVLVMFVLGPLLGSGHAVADALGLGDAFAQLWTWARLPFIFTVLVMWATLLFHLAPHHRTSYRSDLPGALVTGVLWLVFSAGLRLYLEVAGGGNQVLGVIGGFMTVLLWLYLLSLALLLGAELNTVIAVHSDDAGACTSDPDCRPATAQNDPAGVSPRRRRTTTHPPP